MNIKEIKELVKMLDGTDISELTFESEGNRIVIKKGIGGIPYLSPQISPMMQFPVPNVPAAVPNFSCTRLIPPVATSPEKSEGLGPKSSPDCCSNGWNFLPGAGAGCRSLYPNRANG